MSWFYTHLSNDEPRCPLIATHKAARHKYVRAVWLCGTAGALTNKSPSTSRRRNSEVCDRRPLDRSRELAGAGIVACELSNHPSTRRRRRTTRLRGDLVVVPWFIDSLFHELPVQLFSPGVFYPASYESISLEAAPDCNPRTKTPSITKHEGDFAPTAQSRGDGQRAELLEAG